MVEKGAVCTPPPLSEPRPSGAPALRTAPLGHARSPPGNARHASALQSHARRACPMLCQRRAREATMTARHVVTRVRTAVST